MTILNIAMATFGHVLVLPAAHVESIGDLANDDLTALWAEVQRIRRVLLTTLNPDGLLVAINEGAGYATQPHLHVHVLPRYRDDGLDDLWLDGRPERDDDALDRAHGLIAPASAT